ncbi:MAG: hypothetical protein GXP54_10440 [Deltaproteobacteria bacterium]|nr:hypothetical protein [Deltaproteobacteria bacterium]
MKKNVFLMIALLGVCVASPVFSQEIALHSDELSRVMAAYEARKDMARHAEAQKGFKRLAAAHPGDYGLQIWCARTSYYYAHRLVQHDDEDGCAKVAREGITCARRAEKARPRDYTAKYWELMDRMKAGVTLGMIGALKAVKPLKGELERLISLDPKRFEGYLFLGMLYRELPSLVSWGDDDKALEYVKKAERIAPRNADALLEVAETYHKLGNDAMAVAYFGKVATCNVPKHLEWETWDARRWAKKRLKDIQ